MFDATPQMNGRCGHVEILDNGRFKSRSTDEKNNIIHHFLFMTHLMTVSVAETI
jgi:hypothetical protein